MCVHASMQVHVTITFLTVFKHVVKVAEGLVEYRILSSPLVSSFLGILKKNRVERNFCKNARVIRKSFFRVSRIYRVNINVAIG